MQQLEKILAPIDVHNDSKEQIKAIIKLSEVFHSEVLLIYVVPDQEISVATKDILVKSIMGSLNEIKEGLIDKQVKVRQPEVIFGPIVETIVQKATKEKVSLILIGDRQKKKREKFKLGVIAGQIIRESDKPVFVVNGEKETFFSNILCPVDFSEPSKRALHNAIFLAGKFNATLDILTVYEPLKYVSRWTNINLVAENAERLKDIGMEMQVFVAGFDLSGIVYNVEIQSGKIDAKIRNAIKRHGADLLIMGTNGRSGLSRFFMGSVTEKVIREMPCSFITVKSV
jgi:nucleotide-binding universal stress UspA family protein